MLAWALENAAPVDELLSCALIGAPKVEVLDEDVGTLEVHVSILLCMGMGYRNDRERDNVVATEPSMAVSKRRWR